jgi:hypothetical protein
MASSAMELSLLNPAATHRHRGGLAAAGLPLAPRRSVVRFRVSASAAAAAPPKSSGPKKRGKTEIQETLLTPRFYTTDFDEMERLFNAEINKQLNQAEFDALLQEFKTDYNQTHFVRNPEFKAAADKMEGPLRQIFVEFLERSCTAEFSGFLLYKELGRRLKVPSCFFLCLPRLVSSRLVSCTSSTTWWACADALLFLCRKPTRSWRRSSRSCPGTRRAMLGTHLISFHSSYTIMRAISSQKMHSYLLL